MKDKEIKEIDEWRVRGKYLTHSVSNRDYHSYHIHELFQKLDGCLEYYKRLRGRLGEL